MALADRLFGPLADVTADAGYEDHPPRMGFFTDTSICIGCKACEVACKEWNELPEDGLNFTATSYDNTVALSADTWRHVAFIEKPVAPEKPATTVDLGLPRVGPPEEDTGVAWLMSSDVCKHCTHAACLDVCPTGALFRSEFGTVVVQADVCNGCGYCIPACPYGVIAQRKDDVLRPAQGRRGTRVREGLPDGLDPVRPARGVARTG
jgi:formate dehydrogenase iron-sulfur subunit